jgi:LacI family transcriptional regulator
LSDKSLKNVARRITLLDVAADAGLSRATCSLVMRGSPLVAAQTRERVHASMKKLGYVYHRGAASLRTQRSHTAGLVLTDITNPFYAELTLGIESELDAAGYVLILGNTGDKRPRQDRLLGTLHENAADGVLLCPSEGTPLETLNMLRRWQLPVVLLLRYLPDDSCDYVGADNVLGARQATDHLIEHGYRRIAFIGGPANSSARRDRHLGYCQSLEKHGIDPSGMPNLPGPPTRAFGYQAMARLATVEKQPIAILCYNDVVAFGAILALQAAGLSAGKAHAVIGFDDVAEASLWHPALTTVSTSPRSLGATAARLLIERIADPSGERRQVILPPRLVIRDSCGQHGKGHAG